MSVKKYLNVQAIEAASAEAWRNWLSENHRKEQSVWLIIYKKDSGIPSVTYPEAVDEALCFGWIDSKPNKRDDKSYYQFFARRKPDSNWSAINKAKVEKLLNAGKIMPAGQEMIDIARKNGKWDALNEVDALIVPEDMEEAFTGNKTARENWDNFPPSVRRGILEWILNAKRPETRAKRIKETVEKAGENIRANQYRQVGK